MRYGILFLIAAALLWAALPATDTFTAGDGTPLQNLHGGGVWVIDAGAFGVYSNSLVGGSPSNVSLARRVADTYPNDQYAQGVIAEMTGSPEIGVGIRIQAGGNGYYYQCGAGWRALVKIVGGTTTELGSTSNAGCAVSDVIRIEAEGTTIRVFRNGVPDTGLGTSGVANDATFSSGSAGVYAWSAATTVRLDDWEAGALATPPTTRKRRLVITQ